MENQNFENKSLKVLPEVDSEGNLSRFTDHQKDKIIKPCVAFANAQGGTLFIGIEDGEELPPATQIISDQDLPNKIKKRISDLTQNVAVIVGIKSYPNNGQAIEIKILPSKQTIASTNDGKYYLRISDNSVSLLPEDLSQLLTDKPSFIWETRKTNVSKERIDDDKLKKFISEIRLSNEIKVSNHIKQKSDEEILEHYFLTDGDFLTNLGILWIGSRKDRGNLSYCPTITFLKYDERGDRVKKILLDDYYLNPKELVEEVLKFPEWQEGVEISTSGISRKLIKNYPEEVLRELLVNSLVHRPYTQRGEVVIKLYPDYLEINNPGRFPLGVSSRNFLHKSVCRNEKLASVCRALGLMEKEGSGIDKIYESLLSNGKNIPSVFEGDDFLSIKVEKRILNQEVINLIERANQDFQLSQRELISLGLIAENNSLSALEFAKKLSLDFSPSANPTKQWLGNLQDLGIIRSKGKTKAVEYFVNPEFLRKTNFKGKVNLKRIEDHRLKELIYKTVEDYQPISIGGINPRVGKEISRAKLQKFLKKMCDEKTLSKQGSLKSTKYFIRQK